MWLSIDQILGGGLVDQVSLRLECSVVWRLQVNKAVIEVDLAATGRFSIYPAGLGVIVFWGWLLL